MLTIHTHGQIDQHLQIIWKSAEASSLALSELLVRPTNLFRCMKFETLGRHPIEDRPLNLVEQINQTWTFVAALEAVRILLKINPTDEFRVAPGAHAATKFDIINRKEDVCAETFAAVSPNNNNKLDRDLEKLEKYPAIANRYVFFISPRFSVTQRQEQLERSGIQVWSINCNF
jgi:hypothetical protein